MYIPVIEDNDCVILGGNSRALKKAFALADAQKGVTLIVRDTFLATDICAGNGYEISEAWEKRLPDQLFTEKRQLHPDRFKRYLEEKCAEKGIRFFYFMWYVDRMKTGNRQLLRVASKGGIFGILCDTLIDMRQEIRDISYRAYVREGEEKGWSLLCAENAGNNTGSVSGNLFRCKRALLEKFAAQKLENPKLQMGRFAVRGFSGSVETVLKGGLKEENAAVWGVEGKGDIAEKTSENNAKTEGIRVQGASSGELQRWGRYGTVLCPDEIEMEKKAYDVVVIGGGTSGVMAAIHAARGGAKTVLIEPNYELGGTGTIGGVNTYWFGNRYEDVQEIDREIEKLYQMCGMEGKPGIWSGHDHFHAGLRGYVYLKLCREAGVDIAFGQMAYAVVKRQRTVCGVAAAGDFERTVYYGRIILDATGDGDIAAMAGADFVYGNERDLITYWTSLAQYPSPESYKNNFSGMICSFDPKDYTAFITSGRKRGEEMFDHGSYVSMRESRHIRGMRCITLKDLLCFRVYEDGLYTCFSNYDPKGKVTADMVYAGVLPPQMQIQIPLSALMPADVSGERLQGLYVLGKAISVTHNAFPSVRMQPDLMHQGAVMGMIAAISLQKGLLPEELAAEEIRHIVHDATGDPVSLPPYGESAANMARRLSGQTKSHWVDVPFLYEEKEQNELVSVMCAGAEEVLPVIRERLFDEEEESTRQILAGCALWHGEDRWTKEFCSLICRDIERQAVPALPERSGSTCCVQLLPDHGVMPETVYRLNLLAWSKDRCILQPFYLVFDRLKRMQRDYHDIRKGIWHYVEAFAYVAERTGVTAFIPMLAELLEFSEFAEVFERDDADMMKDRFQLLIFLLDRALARLGDGRGYEGLIALAEKGTAAISISACVELEELTGTRHGGDIAAWEKEIRDNPKVKNVQRVSKKYW